MPGVVTSTETRSGPSAPESAPGSTYMVIGLAERGRTDRPIEVRGMGDYYRLLGDRVGYGALHDDLAAFFSVGGQRALVVRRVGSAATVASVDAPATTPAVTFEATSAGQWGNDVDVIVTDAEGTNIDVEVVYRGDTNAVYRNIDTFETLQRRLENNLLVNVVEEAGGLPPADTYTLAGGDDDRATVDASVIGAGADLFPREEGDAALAAPGWPIDDVAADLNAHADERFRIVLHHLPADTTDTAAETAASAYDHERSGVFWPYIVLSDAGRRRTIPPVGYVAGARAAAHREEGPWRAPIGRISEAADVVDVAANVDSERATELDGRRISVIRLIRGRPQLYGWRSLSTAEEDWALLTNADVVNRSVVQAERILERFVGETIDGDGRLLARIRGSLIGMLQSLRDAGGLFPRFEDGELVDPGYSATVSSVDSTGDLAQNKVSATITLRVSPTAATIDLTVVKAGFTAGI